ncbi:acyltransferase family protein [Vibrio sp. TRT 21S02]|uniref:acyltransferase family protein n=1 Tax=Vibrio sp. TRT 21S02 TaxID=3418507 RepID=UPI003CECB92A
MHFRYDINGLRAIAVIAVVLFHFEPSWIPGGFAGVDVFFVISGFLMTGIIFRGLQNNDFSIAKFYVARANRIIPALATLCLFLLIFGWFYLTPGDYEVLGKHIASSVSFLSNVVYWKEAGYFASSSHEKWLLHTWSLSVEWQFYIIYPIVLVLLSKLISLNNIKRLLVIGSVISYGLSVYATHRWPDPSYFLLPTRAWEMMLGGVVFLYPITNLQDQKKRWMEWAGLMLILLSYALVSSDIPWPGHFAAIPVLGAFLILAANRQNSLITNNIVFQKLGKWSYSIYLWHWPIVVAGYYFGIENWWVYGLPLSTFCGYLSFKFIESIKFPSFSQWRSLFSVKPVWMAAFIFALSLPIFLTQGLNIKQRYAANTPEAQLIDKYQRSNYATDFFYQEMRHECNFFDGVHVKPEGISSSCTQSSDKQVGLFVWGDSHSQALAHGFREEFNGNNFYQVASSGCQPSLESDNRTMGEAKLACDRSNKKAHEAVIQLNPKVILFAQRNEHDKNDYLEIIRQLRQEGVTSKFVLVGPVPQWQPSLPRTIAKRHMDLNETKFNDIGFEKDLLRVDDYLEKQYKNSELDYISILNQLCDENGCLAKVDQQNTPLVWDYGHLSYKGSEYVVDNIIYPRIKQYL